MCLWEVIRCANLLGMRRLVQLCCAKVATSISVAYQRQWMLCFQFEVSSARLIVNKAQQFNAFSTCYLISSPGNIRKVAGRHSESRQVAYQMLLANSTLRLHFPNRQVALGKSSCNIRNALCDQCSTLLNVASRAE